MRDYAHMYVPLSILSACVCVCLTDWDGLQGRRSGATLQLLKGKETTRRQVVVSQVGWLVRFMFLSTVGSGPAFKLKPQLQTSSLCGNVLHLTNGLQIVLNCRCLFFFWKGLSTPSPVSKRQKYHYVAVEPLSLQVCVSSTSLLGNIGTAIIFCLFHQ